MTSSDNIELIQEELNYQIYNDIKHYLALTSELCDDSEAFNIIVRAVAINLGAILAQVPDQHREQFVKISNELISQSLTETLKSLDNFNWGQIGHA